MSPRRRTPIASALLLLAPALPLFAGLPLLSACGTGGTVGAAPPGAGALTGPVPLATTARFTVVADSIPDDPGMESLVRPYRDRLSERIEEVIGVAAEPLVKGWPEGTLGNFAADALLWAARERAPDPVDMALMNNGGLRIPIAEGPITVAKVYELMPFDNLLSILTLTGAQVEALAQELAARGGEPIAGWSFRIEEVEGGRVAREVRVGGEPVDPGRRYRLATNDYLANGGDEMQVLKEAVARTDLDVLVRDVFIEYIRTLGTVQARVEGRIQGRVR